MEPEDGELLHRANRPTAATSAHLHEHELQQLQKGKHRKHWLNNSRKSKACRSDTSHSGGEDRDSLS